MISFQFVANPAVARHAHTEIELLYVIHGAARVCVSGRQYHLKSDDYLIVNSDTAHEIEGSEELLLGEFHIQPDKLAASLNLEHLVFRCNSAATDTPEKYEPAREAMQEIFSRYHNNRNQELFRLYSLYYRLLHLLTVNFLQYDSEPDPREPSLPSDGRIGEIVEYIRNNYDKPIRLNDLADQLHLSVAYLSKYIKKNLGASFLDYVTDIRLSHAVTELLHTNAPMARIAMDTGFANLSAFNKAFRDRYHTTPTAYRQQNRSAVTPVAAIQTAAETRSTESGLAPAADKRSECNEVYFTVRLSGAPPTPLRRVWCELVNIDSAAALLRADVQAQVLQLQSLLHCRYIRFWDLYSSEMLLDQPGEDGRYNFSRLDRVLDFLVHNGLQPYLELADKPKRLLLRHHQLQQDPGLRESTFASDDDFFLLIDQLVDHLARRYGAQVMQQWFFEYWKTEAADPDQDDEPGIRAYLDRFDRLSSLLCSRVPGLRLGGGGFSLRFGTENLRKTIELWQQHPHTPYFISLYCYPTADPSDKAAVIENQLVNPNSLHASLRFLHELLDSSGLHCEQVHVTEWNISVVNRMVLHDSYFKGAYIVKNLLDTIGLADLYGYWFALDLFAEGSDCASILSGSAGLLSRDGLPKPALFAHSFLNELGTQLYQKGEGYIVTRDEAGAWRILCHNFKYFNYQFYLMQDDLTVEQLDQLLADTSALNLRFELPAEAGVRFCVKRCSVNREEGNLLELWRQLGSPQSLGEASLEELRIASLPRLRFSTLQEQDGMLRLQTRLDYNEIQLLTLTPLQ